MKVISASGEANGSESEFIVDNVCQCQNQFDKILNLGECGAENINRHEHDTRKSKLESAQILYFSVVLRCDCLYICTTFEY